MSRKGTSVVTAVLFIGIILSCTVFFGVSSLLDFDDGYDINFSIDEFNADFYNNSDLQYLGIYFDYRLFKCVNNKNIIVGYDDFLFEIERNGYNFIEDYAGRLSFSNDELSLIAKNLEQRKKTYNDLGIEYILAVIPNSQTIYSEKMPFFFGDISENTRLDRLEKYLSDTSGIDIVNITDILTRIKNNYPVFNNTENTINSLGAYYLYKDIYRALPYSLTEDTPLIENYIGNISLHYTDGRELAKLSGVSSIVKNRTLSIQSYIPNKYDTYQEHENTETTTLFPEYIDVSDFSPVIMIDYWNEWDKLQLTPFFSSTFSKVVYKKNYNYVPELVENGSISVVAQIIRESELDLLLDSEVALTYNEKEDNTDQ